MRSNIIRSPFFYVGDKYKLMPQLRKLMPSHVVQYIEPFVGGGSSFLNLCNINYILNDSDYYIIALHKVIGSYSHNQEELFLSLYDLIKFYGLSCSHKGHNVPDELKLKFKKTYYAKYNKEAYNKLRRDFNKDKKDILKLYLLLIYGFNHMIRFNSEGEYNLPVGNVDFNDNVYYSLINYMTFSRHHSLEFYNYDYIHFLDHLIYNENSYVYFDPPYLISLSEYNKFWDETKDVQLYEYIDSLHNKGIKFGISNLIHHKGRTNLIFKRWIKKYKTYSVSSNYISFNDNSIKNDSLEVFVTNYV